MTRVRLLLLAVALTGAGCIFITQFDPESQPCEVNAPVGEQCLNGFRCVTEGQPDGGICKRVDAGQ